MRRSVVDGSEGRLRAQTISLQAYRRRITAREALPTSIPSWWRSTDRTSRDCIRRCLRTAAGDVLNKSTLANDKRASMNIRQQAYIAVIAAITGQATPTRKLSPSCHRKRSNAAVTDHLPTPG